MRQLLCKRLSLFLTIFLFTSTLQAQDSSKAVTRPAQRSATQPAKQNSKTPVQIQSPQSATTANETSAVQVAATSGDNSLNGQYEALLKHSWMQQGYKVINPGRLTTLWKSVNDTLQHTRTQLADVQKQLEKQASLLEELKESSSSKNNIAASNQVSRIEVRQVGVLGMSVDASTYNWIVGGTILFLAIALAVASFTLTRNSGDAKQHKQLYEEISSEYQTYKAKAKEKELKLARELQTERNTIEELLAKRSEEEERKR